jgi:hypothetical protein
MIKVAFMSCFRVLKDGFVIKTCSLVIFAILGHWWYVSAQSPLGYEVNSHRLGFSCSADLTAVHIRCNHRNSRRMRVCHFHAEGPLLYFEASIWHDLCMPVLPAALE